MRVLVINGPNLNLLGMREPEVYGTKTLRDIEKMLLKEAEQSGCSIRFFQSNHEGALVDAVQGALKTADGILINPAAYTHTSVALLDALTAVRLPAVEVHLSDPDAREPFRRISYVRPACIACVKGKGAEGYVEALKILIEHLSKGE